MTGRRAPGSARTIPARHRARLAALLCPVVLAAAGCGKKGPPMPPAPRGPYAPRQVVARQVGDTARISFDVSAARGAKPAQQPQVVELLRVGFAPGVTPGSDPDVFRRRGVVIEKREDASVRPGARLTLIDRTAIGSPGNGPGATLRYAVRVRDRRGRPSPLVVALDLVLAEPAPAPTGLRAEPTADGIRLVWTAPSGEGPFKYNVYRTTPDAPPPEAPLNTTPLTAPEFLDGSVVTGNTYRYFVRVALAEGPPYREGRTSEILEVVAEDRFAPEAPRGLVAVQEGPAVRLFWNPSSERDLGGYRVYRAVDGADWARIGPDPVEQALYLDADVKPGMRLAYRVTAIDRAGPPNESEPSEPVEVDVLAEPSVPEGDP